MAGLVQWPSVKSFNDLFDSETYKKAEPYKNAVLDKIDLLHTRFVFN